MAVQAVAVGLLFALLLVTPLPEAFFRDHGMITGPVAWLLCSLVTARLLGIKLLFGLACGLASGAGAALVGVAGSHSAGLLVGVLAFGVLCSVRRGDRQPARA